MLLGARELDTEVWKPADAERDTIGPAAVAEPIPRIASIEVAESHPYGDRLAGAGERHGHEEPPEATGPEARARGADDTIDEAT